MFEPLLFLHVADAGLDLPLADLDALPENLQTLAQDAALIAFQNMIAEAVSRNVDCVLLAGNTFRERDRSLRARLTLRKGLRELAEVGISVFVLPGPDDPESAWRDIPQLPSNVTLLTSGDEECEVPVAMLREGRVIATITAGTLSQLSRASESELPADVDAIAPVPSQNGQARAVPFRIGFLAAWPEEPLPHTSRGDELVQQLSDCGCDYLAVPQSDPLARPLGWQFAAGQTLNTNEGIAHHPGPLQGLSARETGPHGGTLIEVDQDGEIRGTFLPLAPVRRMRFVLPIEPAATLDDLAESMSLLLASETQQTRERAWCLTWALQGRGPFFASLKDPNLQMQLFDAVSQMLGDESLPIHHQVEFQESPALPEDEREAGGLERLYQQALDNVLTEHPAVVPFVTNEVLSDIQQLDDADWQERLKPLVAEMDAQALMAKVRSLGRQWFQDVAND